MRNFSIRLYRLFFTLLTTLCLVPAAVPAQTAPDTRSVQDKAADDALLNKARSMYYSARRAGLASFDCKVHPDWLATFVDTNPGTDIASDDPRVVLLSRVAMVLHVRLKGGSASLDWTPPSGVAFTSDQTNLLNGMHHAVAQALRGFVQFWTLTVDGSMIPENSSGLTVVHTPTTFTIYQESGVTTVRKVFSNDLLLQLYGVATPGTSIRYEPAFMDTPQGLLVEHYRAYLENAADPTAPDQQMRVWIQYQTVEGFPIPSRLDMELVGNSVLNVTLDQCTVLR